MFERFTERARRTLFFARYESTQFGSPAITPEHMLLGLIREDKGLVSQLLARAHIPAQQLRTDVARHLVGGPKTPSSVEIPFTDATKRLLQTAAEEATALGHSYVGAEHLLLGVLLSDGTAAAAILREKGMDVETVRREIARLSTGDAPAQAPPPADPHVHIVLGVYDAFRKGDVDAILARLSPDIEWCEPDNPFNPAAGTRKGEAGFREWLRIGHDAEDILALEPRQILSNPDSVAVVGHAKCLAKPTGRTYETDFVHVVTFRDGKIVRFQEYFDTFAAAEAFRP